MNKEYQEATNEYLKVCFPLLPWLLCYLVFGWREMGMGNGNWKEEEGG
jgi:hypothetical protein